MEVVGRESEPQATPKNATRDQDTPTNATCDPCEYAGEKQDAEFYCTECDEFMCFSCAQSHKKLRATRKHNLLSGGDLPRKRPSLHTEINCSKHEDKPFEYFCNDHNAVCCSVCINLEHISCDKEYILDHVDKFKNGGEYEAILQKLKELEKLIQDVTSEVDRNVATATLVSDNIVDEIRKFRTEINDKLDSLERKALKRAKIIKNRNIKVMTDLTSELDTMKAKIDETTTKLENFYSLKQYKQLVITAKLENTYITTLENRIAELCKGNTVTEQQFCRNEEFVRFINFTLELGSIEEILNGSDEGNEENEQFPDLKKMTLDQQKPNNSSQTQTLVANLNMSHQNQTGFPAFNPISWKQSDPTTSNTFSQKQSVSVAFNPFQWKQPDSTTLDTSSQKQLGITAFNPFSWKHTDPMALNPSSEKQTETTTLSMSLQRQIKNTTLNTSPQVPHKQPETAKLNTSQQKQKETTTLTTSPNKQTDTTVLNTTSQKPTNFTTLITPPQKQTETTTLNTSPLKLTDTTTLNMSRQKQTETTTLNMSRQKQTETATLNMSQQKQTETTTLNTSPLKLTDTTTLNTTPQKQNEPTALKTSPQKQTETTTLNTSPQKLDTIPLNIQHQKSINIKHTEDRERCWITGSIMLDSSRLALVDYDNSSVKILDMTQSNITHYLNLESRPRDITQTDQGQLVVTCPHIQSLLFINVVGNTLRLDRQLNVGGACLGIDYGNDLFIVSFIYPKLVKLIKTDGQIVRTISTDSSGQPLFDNPSYVVFSKDRQSVYVSDRDKDSITHLDINGTVLGVYTSNDLTWPLGVTVDRHNNVYIAWSGNVCVLTAGSTQIQPVVKVGGPQSVLVRDDSDQMIVGSINELIVYKMH